MLKQSHTSMWTVFCDCSLTRIVEMNRNDQSILSHIVYCKCPGLVKAKCVQAQNSAWRVRRLAGLCPSKQGLENGVQTRHTGVISQCIFSSINSGNCHTKKVYTNAIQTSLHETFSPRQAKERPPLHSERAFFGKKETNVAQTAMFLVGFSPSPDWRGWFTQRPFRFPGSNQHFRWSGSNQWS